MRKKYFILFILLIISTFILTGCTNIKDGIIIDKNYRDSYITTSFIYNGGKMFPITTYHPAIYQFKIQKEINGKSESSWVSVNSKTYENYEVGDYYNKGD